LLRRRVSTRSCLTPRLVSKQIRCCADEHRLWRYASMVIAKAAAIRALRRLRCG
jgi:hypothetical protein